MDKDVPGYLIDPTTVGACAGGSLTYGRVRKDGGYYVIEDAEPVVFEMAKRMFPGCGFANGGRRLKESIRFRDTRRAVGDLNWLMLRFPMRIEDPGSYEFDRQRAIHHAQRREKNQSLSPTRPPSAFKGTLLDYQAEGVSFLLANERTLLADDMGLGKTVEALAAIATADAFPVILVVMPNGRIQWKRMAETFLELPKEGTLFSDSKDLCHIIDGLKPYRLPARPVYIIHYGLLRGWKDSLLEVGAKAIVFDEIQELRHTGTQKYSVASELAGDCHYAWGLSGTPIYNYGSEIWSVLNIVDYHCLGDWESFTREWCTGYQEKVVAKPDVLSRHLRREGLMIRRRKADVQAQLPPKRRVVHMIDHDEDVYGGLVREATRLASSYAQISAWRERGEAALRIESESRRATGVSKAPYVAEFVRALLQAGERPLVYAWHHDVHNGLMEKLAEFRIVQITGQQTAAQKDAAIQQFDAEQADAVLLSLRATAGIDGLQRRATCVVFAELDWSPAIHSQCEDRLQRIGMGELDSVLCYYLVSQTGYDGVVMDVLGLKIGQFVGLMDDPGLTAADKDVAESAGQRHLERIIERLNSKAGKSNQQTNARRKGSDDEQTTAAAGGGSAAVATGGQCDAHDGRAHVEVGREW